MAQARGGAARRNWAPRDDASSTSCGERSEKLGGGAQGAPGGDAGSSAGGAQARVPKDERVPRFGILRSEIKKLE
eukprot:3045118-Pyramimonas_sp.AAC.1